MPDWIGVGVAMPLVGVGFVDVALAVLDGVGSVGMPQFCSTQYEFPFTRVHVDLMEGFCIHVRR
jgi:hypothetical protein